jgi:hypothetical protein
VNETEACPQCKILGVHEKKYRFVFTAFKLPVVANLRCLD